MIDRLTQAKQQEKESRRVGHPKIEVFPNKAVEEDFIQRAVLMVEKYFDPNPERKGKNFVFSADCRMGCGRFWQYICYYYIIKEIKDVERSLCPLFPELDRPLAGKNFRGICTILSLHIRRDALCDRTAFSRYIDKDPSTSVLSDDFVECPSYNSAIKADNKARYEYRQVIKCWFECKE